MTRARHLTTALLGAAILMTALTTSASARSFSTSSETFRVTWARLSFREPVFGFTLTCPLTLEGSLHGRTIAKGSYNLIGYVNKAVFGPAVQCSGGEATVLTESLPWHLRYESFSGALPNITGIRTLIAGASFRFHVTSAGATCLFTTRETLAEHGRGIFNREAGGALSSAELSGEITSNEACVLGTRVRLILASGPGSVTAQSSASRITITLI